MTRVDIDALARERTAPAELRPPRRWLRIALPALLVAVFAAVLASSLGDLFGGAREVAIVRPVPVASTGARAAAGEILVQAAGWVEPEPLPMHVTSLADGVIEELLFLESDRVEAGQVLARLVDDDARLALAAAEGKLARTRGELAHREAELAAARESFDEALAPTEALAVAEAELEGARAAAERRAEAVAGGAARLAIETEELEVQRALHAEDAAGPRQVELAEARVEEARAALAGLEAEAELAQAQVPAAEARRARAARELDLRIEDRRRVAAAEADLAAAEGALAEAVAARDEAALRLERMEVRAPADGVILRRLATVGSHLAASSIHGLATMYDPTSLRVRVDVPQQELAGLAVGQTVHLECDARPGRPYEGEVIRLLHEADIQKVTVQAQVRVLDTDGLLVPEMLVQARFLAAEVDPGAADVGSTGSAVAIPASLLAGGDRVWVLDPTTGRATARRVKTGARRGDLVVIDEGLNLSDKLLDPGGGEPLVEGERVKAKGGSR